jgi:hypothetical protein
LSYRVRIKPAIRQTLACDLPKKVVGPFLVRGFTIVPAKVKLSHITLKMLFTDMMVTLNHEGKVERSSYGDPGFTTLNAVALLEWAKMQVYDETP